MLSPGTYHRHVPKNLKENLLYRRWLLKRCDAEPAYRDAVREMCRTDILFHINATVFQFNPKDKDDGEAGRMGPFITYDFQDEAIRELLWCIENDEDVLIEKSRQMGASWLMLIIFDWFWRYVRGASLLMISRDEKMVDSPMPKSLFWKISYIHRNTPDFLMPKKWEKQKLVFVNEDLDSYIFGEASTGKSGVGGTVTAMAIDEFSQIDDAYEVLARTSDTTGCRIFNGTHKGGAGTPFFELSQRVDLKKIVMHWTQHPKYNPGRYYYSVANKRVEALDPQYKYPADYQFIVDGKPAGGPFPGVRSPWYDKQCTRKPNERKIAEDLDINPTGSAAQVFNAMLIRELLASTREPDWVGTLEHDPDFAQPKRLVDMPEGLVRLWLRPDHRGRLPVDHYVLGCDLSRGEGVTPSCCTVFRPSTGEKVGEIVTATMEPSPFARLIVALARHLVDEDGEGAFLIWEGNGPGDTFGKIVTNELGYLRCHKRKSELQWLFSGDPKEYGWSPTAKNKMLLIDQYHIALRTREFANYSEWALKECLAYKISVIATYVHPKEVNTDDPSGAKINHGDRVVADALAWLGAKHYPRASPVAEKETAKVLSRAWRDELVEKQRRAEESWI